MCKKLIYIYIIYNIHQFYFESVIYYYFVLIEVEINFIYEF